MIIFTEKEIRNYVQQNEEVLLAMEEGFSRLQANRVTMPPILRIDFPENNGEIDVKSAYVHGVDKFAVKMSTGFFNNASLGLPSGNGMMILLSTKTGLPQAILLDNGYLTHLRTAAAGAVAAKYLAKGQIETVGVIGTGSQARYQIEALQLVRSFDRLLIYGRNKASLTSYLRDISAVYHGEIIVCETAEEAVVESDLVVTTTPAEEPVIKADWLHPGLHITAMGSDAAHKNEIEASAFRKIDKIVCDSKAQCFRFGELHHARRQGIVTNDSKVMELGALTAGEKRGRTSTDQITICDLTGTGVQDTMMAVYAYEVLAAENKIGTYF